MPNKQSAEKRLRQDEKRRLLNKARKTELKTLNKQFVRAVHDGQKDEATSLCNRLAKRMDQAASRNVLHKNTVSRRKSAIAKQLNSLSAS